MTVDEMTDAEFEQLAERANAFVRQQTADFLAKLSRQVERKFGGWELTSACYRENLTNDPAAEVARAIASAMGGNVC